MRWQRRRQHGRRQQRHRHHQVGLADADHLGPGDVVGRLRRTHARPGLLRADQAGCQWKRQPHLATSWKYNSDGTQVTFTLKKGLVFSDGSPLNAAAVKKSLERARDASNSLVAAQLADLKTVTAPNATTVVLDLVDANYQYPNLLAGKTGMVVNPAAFGNNAKSIATLPAGSGPFKLTSYTQNAKAVLVKNPKYFEADTINAAGFELYPAADGSTVVAALQSGQYNVGLLPPSQIDAAKAAGLEVQIIPSMYVAVLDVNAAMAPFTDPAVIEALHYAVDRAELVKVAQFGVGDVDYQPFPEGYVGYDPALADIYAYNPDKAKSILKAAGHTSDITLKLSVYAPEGVPELLQAQLKKVGIDASIEVLPLAEATQIIYIQHSRALAVDGFAGRESPVQAFQVLFGSEGLMNPSRQANPELQAAIAKVQQTPLDSPDYPTLLQAATAIGVKSMPNTFLYTIPRVMARSKSVSELPRDQVPCGLGRCVRVMTAAPSAPTAPAPAPGPRSRRSGRPAERSSSPGRSAGCWWLSVTVFFFASVLTFALGALSGSNPAAAVLGETATPTDIARMNHQFGLDVPLWHQYVNWLGNALHGDLGASWFTTIPVSDSIRQALPVDLSIAGLALLLAILIGGGAGIAAALSNGGVDRPVGHGRVLGRRGDAAVRDRHAADHHLRGEARAAACRAATSPFKPGPDPVAALRDPAAPSR